MIADELPIIPPQGSVEAAEVDALFYTLLGISTVVLLVLFVLIWAFCLRYRASREATREQQQKHEERVELIWTLSPLVVFFFLFGWAAALYIESHEPPEDSLQIQVLGRQWMWEFYHPDGTRELNQLHVPTGRPIRLLMATEDVIHSVFIPAFRIKQDVVPGRLTQAWFTPLREGVYHLFCAEYCGTRHAKMGGQVTVMTPERYQQWLAEHREPAGGLAGRGRELYDTLGCRDCHAPNTTVAAPVLDGAFGKTVVLADGSRIEMDEAYVRDSILDPEKQVTAGFEPVMPSYADSIGEAEVMALTAYIRALGGLERADAVRREE